MMVPYPCERWHGSYKADDQAANMEQALHTSYQKEMELDVSRQRGAELQTTIEEASRRKDVERKEAKIVRLQKIPWYDEIPKVSP